MTADSATTGHPGPPNDRPRSPNPAAAQIASSGSTRCAVQYSTVATANATSAASRVARAARAGARRSATVDMHRSY